jgi:soluble lytic murein transglycosylase-like protein
MKRVCIVALLVATAFAAETPAPIGVVERGWYAVLANGYSIRHVRREDSGETTRLWLGSTSYVDVPAAQIVRFEQEEIAPAPPKPAIAVHPVVLTPQQAIAAASARHAIDPDFVSSVVRAESAFNARAVSPKGARGLMQLMPATAAQLGVADSFDPNANVEGGTRYLRALLEQYHGDVPRALAAYNAGPHRVAQYRGVPPYAETRAYVNRVIRDYNRAKLAAEPKLARKSPSR